MTWSIPMIPPLAPPLEMQAALGENGDSDLGESETNDDECTYELTNAKKLSCYKRMARSNLQQASNIVGVDMHPTEDSADLGEGGSACTGLAGQQQLNCYKEEAKSELKQAGSISRGETQAEADAYKLQAQALAKQFELEHPKSQTSKKDSSGSHQKTSTASTAKATTSNNQSNNAASSPSTNQPTDAQNRNEQKKNVEKADDQKQDAQKQNDQKQDNQKQDDEKSAALKSE